jgi:H/ACA ribonucleoprotein complex subunit 4
MNIHKDVSKTDLKKALKKFTGKIMQRVPKVSAVKRQTREREIYSIKLISFKDRIAVIDVECQAGTYIRKLIHDIGVDLGTGAHMFELRRTKSGPFTEKDAIPENKVRNYLMGDETKLRKVLIPLEKAVSEIRKVWVDDGVLKPWSYGSPVYFNGILKFSKGIFEKEKIAVFNRKNELIGIGIAKADSKSFKTSKEGVAVRNFLNLIPNG